MSLIVVEDLSLSFGGRSIFDGFDLRVGEQDRLGIVGRNGTGKSTLLKVLAGVQEPDSGLVRSARSTRVGYLAQEFEVDGSRPLLEYILASVPGRTELEEQLKVCEQALDDTDDPDEQMAVATKLADLHESILHFDTNWSPHEAHVILAGLGFSLQDADRNLHEFSGGWQMRAVLAGLLFQQPDLLLLDEPTNHLDITTVSWLSGFLRGYPKALALICHDREFLNEQVNRVISFEPEAIRQYPGNYDEYLRRRAEESEVLERRAVNLAREREQAERFIRRFRYQATKARAVQSRIKALEKMDEVSQLQDMRSMSFKFPPCKRAGQDVIKLDSLGHSYGKLRVFGGANLNVRRGDKVAIIGPNGAGKTTLLKIFSGQLSASEGSIEMGHNVTPGYYAQHVAEELDLRRTIFDEVWSHSAIDDVTAVRSILGSFLFSNDDVDKYIRVLSGGEKARVALARLMVDPGNLLLMDEPTNHLDLESSESLATALTTYDGTVVFVSHNRSFVGRLANRIWHVHDGTVEEFPGSFEEFLYHLQLNRGAGADPDTSASSARRTEANRNGNDGGTKSTDQTSKVRSKTGGESTAKNKVQGPTSNSKALASPGGKVNPQSGVATSAQRAKELRKQEYADNKRRRSEAKSLERTIGNLEGRIAALEVSQGERSSELSRPEIVNDSSRYAELLRAYSGDSEKLAVLMSRWEKAQEKLGELTSDAEAGTGR